MPNGSPALEILLVEDDPVAAGLFVDRLKNFAPGEFAVTQARTLASGLDEAAEIDFSLAVLDLTLPDSHGIQTCSRFASAQPNLPFLVLTGVQDAHLTQTLERAGAAATLVKDDCEGRDLVNAVRTAARPPFTTSPAATKQASRARFRNAIVESADGLLVIGLDGRIVLVSAGAESLLGRSAGELTGTPLGIDLKPGRPVRAQVIREEEGLTEAPQADGTVRHFDVSRLHVNEIEFWPFSHQWTNKPVTVCAMRDITNQSAEEHRQRNLIRLAETLEISGTAEAICTDVAVKLGSLVRFNRFEAAVWRPDLNRLQVICELGSPASARTVSSIVDRDHAPNGFGSWMSEWSTGNHASQVALSIGCVEADAYRPRDASVLARCANSIAAGLADLRDSPLFAPRPAGATDHLIRTSTFSLSDGQLPGAA